MREQTNCLPTKMHFIHMDIDILEVKRSGEVFLVYLGQQHYLVNNKIKLIPGCV